MKSIRKFLYIASLCILAQSQIAQAQISNVLGSMNKPLLISEQYKNTDGSPYYNEEYLPGKIFDKDGKVRDVVLKYDTYRDEVELLMDGQVILIAQEIYPKFVIEEIDLELKKVVSREFSNTYVLPGQKKNKYSQVLFSNSKAKILKAIQTVLVENSDPGFAGLVVNDRFDIKAFYFLVDADNQVTELKLNTNAIVNALPNETELKQYFKKNKIKIKDEADLVELLSYFESKK
ncbi:MAG: hypothetical protein COW40_06230 [Cytophagales bacterium CG17_big_fil_post_rev_8_21_14_2_50_40_13]|nr:MAG: hypothetical protein COW40_06230 [Cytophagales bacterium CG17_big_fil_post_rev_8_21_14_2_50_40_13]